MQLVHAENSYLSELQFKATQDNLSLSQGWLALLHYKSSLFGGYESQTNDIKFFNSENGNVSPENELLATLEAFFEHGMADKNLHPQCRFPARYYWLDKKLDFDKTKLKVMRCPELEKWREEIKPNTIDLIFPAAFLNGPSSMFGHTLLRVNSRDYRKDIPLVSYALNYAANADATDNALIFSIKGLVGGYPGIFSIVPYYEKLNEYRDIENRDIWEYALNLTQEEVNQLLRHAWELRYINFDYFYITQNCSYHMLSLMEVARPGLKLTYLFDNKAIPIDTVRAVINAELVDNINYRPSTTTSISYHANEMDKTENELVMDLTKGKIRTDDSLLKLLTVKEYARVLEQSYDYSRFLSTANPSVRDVRSKQNWELLAARSQNSVKKIWSEIQRPPVRPDDSHATARWAIGLGDLAGLSYLALKLRPVYHDLLDPIGGYTTTSQINFLDIQLRYFKDTEKVRLDKFTIFNVLSLSPRDLYFDPISWGVDFGIEEVNSLQGKINVTQLTVDGGLSYPAGDWVISSMIEGKFKVANRLQKGYTAGIGFRFNLLRQGSGSSTQFMFKSLAYRAGEENTFIQASLAHSFHLGANETLRWQAARTREYDNYASQLEFVFNRFF